MKSLYESILDIDNNIKKVDDAVAVKKEFLEFREAATNEILKWIQKNGGKSCTDELRRYDKLNINNFQYVDAYEMKPAKMSYDAFNNKMKRIFIDLEKRYPKQHIILRSQAKTDYRQSLCVYVSNPSKPKSRSYGNENDIIVTIEQFNYKHPINKYGKILFRFYDEDKRELPILINYQP